MPTQFTDLSATVMDIWRGVDDDEDAPLEEVELLELTWDISDSEIIAVLETVADTDQLLVAAAVAGCRGLTAALSPLLRLWRSGITDEWLYEYAIWAIPAIDPQAFDDERQRQNLTAFWIALSEYAARHVAERGGYQMSLF